MNIQQLERQKRTMFMVLFAAILAIEALVCFTPLGSLPTVGPIVATLALVPVVIAGVLLGPTAGGLMGLFAGLFSFLVWTFMPPPQSVLIAFVFTPFNTVGVNKGNIWSLVICFIPRIMAGIISGFSFILMKNKMHMNNHFLVNFLSGAIGSLMNTLGVLTGIFLFFRKPYSNLNEKTYTALFFAMLLTVLFSGVPEAVIGGLGAHSICKPAKKYIFKSDLSIFTDNTEKVVSAVAITFTVMLYIFGAILN